MTYTELLERRVSDLEHDRAQTLRLLDRLANRIELSEARTASLSAHLELLLAGERVGVRLPVDEDDDARLVALVAAVVGP